MNDLVATFTQTTTGHPSETGSPMDCNHERAMSRLTEELQRLNAAVMAAVDSGLSIEITRSARHHGGNGNWGDIMVPSVVRR